MQISPQEIAEIEEIGTLNGSPVKLLKTKGGWWCAVDNKKALAAGSHSAIVKYNLEKQYPGFRPSLMKSEKTINNPIVTKHSHFLSDDLKKSGHDIYSIQYGTNIEFQITKHEAKIGNINAFLENNSIIVKNDMNISKEFSKSLAAATMEKAISCGIADVKIQGK